MKLLPSSSPSLDNYVLGPNDPIPSPYDSSALSSEDTGHALSICVALDKNSPPRLLDDCRRAGPLRSGEESRAEEGQRSQGEIAGRDVR